MHGTFPDIKIYSESNLVHFLSTTISFTDEISVLDTHSPLRFTTMVVGTVPSIVVVSCHLLRIAVGEEMPGW